MRGCLSFSPTPPTPSGWIPGCWSWHEAGWTWDFVCWKISDYSFNLCACDGSDKIFFFLFLSFFFFFYKIFYFFLVQFLESCTFLRICLFLPSCPFYWHIIADSSLLWSFVFFCVVCFDFSIFISNFVNMILLPIFLTCLAVVCIFYLSSKSQTLFSFADFCYSLLCFFFIFSALVFMIAFLLLTLGFFISSFSCCFRY